MAAKEPTVERRHREAASELVNKVAVAWVDDPSQSWGLSTREVDLLTRAAQLLADAEQRGREQERAAIVAHVRVYSPIWTVQSLVQDIEAGKHLEER